MSCTRPASRPHVVEEDWHKLMIFAGHDLGPAGAPQRADARLDRAAISGELPDISARARVERMGPLPSRRRRLAQPLAREPPRIIEIARLVDRIVVVQVPLQ